jgi:hypothetical protein
MRERANETEREENVYKVNQLIDRSIGKKRSGEDKKKGKEKAIIIVIMFLFIMINFSNRYVKSVMNK